jgi:hypothetical protein
VRGPRHEPGNERPEGGGEDCDEHSHFFLRGIERQPSSGIQTPSKYRTAFARRNSSSLVERSIVGRENPGYCAATNGSHDSGSWSSAA